MIQTHFLFFGQLFSLLDIDGWMVNLVARDTPLIAAKCSSRSNVAEQTCLWVVIQNIQLCQFYKIKGIAPSFWGLPAFSGRVSQFCVEITPIELKSVTVT